MMMETATSASGGLLSDPGLRRYWDKLNEQRANIDPSLLDTSDIALIFTASDDPTAGTVTGSDKHGEPRDSVEHA